MRYVLTLIVLSIISIGKPVHSQILFGRLGAYEVDFIKMGSDLLSNPKDPNNNNIGRWMGCSVETYYLKISEGTKAGYGFGAGLQGRYIFNGTLHIRPEFVWSPAYVHKSLVFRFTIGPTLNFVQYRKLTGITGTYFRKANYDKRSDTCIGVGIAFGSRTAKSWLKVPIDNSIEYFFTPSASKYASDEHLFMLSFAVGFTIFDFLE
jgi:hypothetical protein